MPSVTTEVPHSLPVVQATQRVKGLMTRLRAKYGSRLSDVDEWWGADRGDFSFALSGVRVKGVVDVLPQAIRARIELPLAAMLFRASIESAIRQELAASLR